MIYHYRRDSAFPYQMDFYSHGTIEEAIVIIDLFAEPYDQSDLRPYLNDMIGAENEAWMLLTKDTHETSKDGRPCTIGFVSETARMLFHMQAVDLRPSWAS